MPDAPQSAASEIRELQAQIQQLEQDVVSAALATNDEQVDALREVCGNCRSESASPTLVPKLSDCIPIVPAWSEHAQWPARQSSRQA